MRRLLPLLALVTASPLAAQTAHLIPISIVTDAGTIEAELDSTHAPITVANFLKYVDAHKLDSGAFFRTVRPDNQVDKPVKIAVIQSRTGRSSGAAFPAIELERTNVTGLRHRDGTLSMARAGANTATNQFFICIGDQPELDFGGKRNPDGQGFAAFGQVTRGMDIVRKIQNGPATGETLTTPVTILRIVRR